jgi:prolyl-tRNA editing enzyme YbaK/EbsC (Cys-tRNA(Pro) deacylase)
VHPSSTPSSQSSPSPSTSPTTPGAADSSGEATARPEHPAITGFRAALREAGGTGRIVVLPDSVHTAKLAAEALGCEVGAIANSLLFDAAGSPVLVLTSGRHRVDVDKVAAEQGLPPLERATPEFVRTHTGQVIGGVSPLAHPAPVPTYLDRSLRDHPELWAAAGHPAAVFSTTYDELLALTAATEIEVR